MASKAFYETYEKIKHVGLTYYKDRGFCAVVAVAVSCGVGYGKAYHTLRRLGRVHGQGTYRHQTLGALEELGRKVTPIKGLAGKQVRTLPRVLGKGMFLVFVNRHVLCVRDGDVVDWTAGRAHRVREVWQIEEA